MAKTKTKIITKMELIDRKFLIQNAIKYEYEIVESKSITNIKNKREEKLINIEKKEIAKFKLKKIKEDEIKNLRANGIPGFILKEKGNYYYTEINNNSKFLSSTLLGTHICTNCKHLSAFPDELGGCARIRNNCSNIEKFDFITLGYETFNVLQECFVVIKCKNQESFDKRKIKQTKRQTKN